MTFDVKALNFRSYIEVKLKSYKTLDGWDIFGEFRPKTTQIFFYLLFRGPVL